MKDLIFDDFQNSVDECLLRHKSLLDILSKLQESQSRVNRAVTKSVTNCGCIELNAKKQNLPCDDDSICDMNFQDYVNSHVAGKLCDNCRDILEREMGNHLFYIAALCNNLDLNFYDILLKEYDKMSTLGKFTFR